MWQFYLSKKFFVLALFATLCSFILGLYKLTAIFVFTFSIVAIYLRKNRVVSEALFDKGRECILPPINGKVVRIINNIEASFKGQTLKGKAIVLKQTFLSDKGLFFPSRLSLHDLQRKNGNVSMLSSPSDFKKFQSLNLLFHGKEEKKILLCLGRNHIPGNIQMVISPGDRGLTRANFGHTFFPISVIILIPSTYNIQVKPRQVINSNTILATDEHDVDS